MLSTVFISKSFSLHDNVEGKSCSQWFFPTFYYQHVGSGNVPLSPQEQPLGPSLDLSFAESIVL